MRIYMVRHGESECNRLHHRCGWSKTPLSEKGRMQAREAGERLKGITFDKVFSSDLPRAVETATLALPYATLVLRDTLREINVGNLTDRPAKECEEEYKEAYWDSMKQQNFRAFGGESTVQLKERVADFVRELEGLEHVENVAVFGHEGTLWQMLQETLQAEVELEHMRVDNASVSVFSFEKGVWKLVAWNYTGRL